jgi:predicted Co/Zn/Cd cation transporter (cation efflux family)
LAGSRVIVFDGVSAIIGLVLSVMSLIAARAASRPETPQYPYGRQSLIPLVVGGQGPGQARADHLCPHRLGYGHRLGR